MNINRWTRGRHVWPGRVFFAGGYPLVRYRPRVVVWGPYVSIFWLGTELVIRFRSLFP